MKTSLALATASVAGLVCGNVVDLLIPRNVMVEEAAAEYMAMCPSCCTGAVHRTTIKETYYATETETKTVYTTATEHDVSTEIQHTTEFVTKTSVSTFTTSYPVTVTQLVNCTKRPPVSPTQPGYLMNRTHPKREPVPECETVTSTEWRTETATKTVLVPTVSIVPTTVTDVETVTQIRNQSVTQWVPTTYTATVTRTSTYPVTVTSENDVTVTTKSATTETIVTTVTTSYPVISYETVTQPASTVTFPGSSTRVTLCPQPTGVYVPLDPNSNLTFGCRPGTVCSPHKPDGCNVWPGPPADDFQCLPCDCIPAPFFTPIHWNGNGTQYYPQPDAYFGLDPTVFSLPYDVFLDPGYGVGIRTRYAPLPPVCLDDCSNAYNLGQFVGKEEELCRPQSIFQRNIDSCKLCITVHASVDALKDYIDPVFSQFTNFCKGRRSEPKTTSATASPELSASPPGPESGLAPLTTTTQVSASQITFKPSSSASSPESATPSQPPAASQSQSSAASQRQSSAASQSRSPAASQSQPSAASHSQPSSTASSLESARQSQPYATTGNSETSAKASGASSTNTSGASSANAGASSAKASGTSSAKMSDTSISSPTGKHTTAAGSGTNKATLSITGGPAAPKNTSVATATTAAPGATTATVVVSGATVRFGLGSAFQAAILAMIVAVLI